jgi:hypothetical protein
MGLLRITWVQTEQCHELAFALEAWLQDSGEIGVPEGNTCFAFVDGDHADDV